MPVDKAALRRSDEAKAWFSAVYRAVQGIPPGRVTSYGHIALLLGYPERPRQVGVCLKHLPSASDQPDARYNGDTVPWQRVVNAKGTISPRGSGTARQEAALVQEGVEVGRGNLGERTVDFGTYGWFPARLPSQGGGDLLDEDDEDDGENGEGDGT
ncbi:hypothetical protein BAUCODRAFT_76630 [Baudoinia panamericana UAMH 10762]|uniref:Methylated-DNA-[protein]-cysteine S-methyltransferase DNA binding domain-containing protein n=1 Tax=Baudoinia panamericana (strain UAMH 10762) TaxID=717646 RepID=M2M8B5_BAUPA|nr:uncharacterized protein BAUCODRAFT_76630 [Baudoinia panamericana UAMH 10762]EMC92606.1 hypothetical protein BAUCODRAFT_76630 [Baudoinia panamericana UAMH 10762]